MTAQIQDACTYRDEAFSVAGISAGTLFDPASVGLRPVGVSTACWRGYRAVYALRDQHLVLRELAFAADQKSADAGHPVLDGQSPDPFDGFSMGGFSHAYRGLALPVVYTGGLLLANDFIRALYLHMGFHPAWKYRVVHELVFDRGRLVAERDLSQRMAELRGRLAEGDPGTTPEDPSALREAIARAFERRYDR